jgi:hypothetical protein
MDSFKVRQYTNEVLQQFGSKEVFRGTVAAIDEASGTTAWIKLEGQDKFYLAFCKSEGRQVLFVGQIVEFRISGMSAVDVQVVEAPEASETIAQEQQHD